MRVFIWSLLGFAAGLLLGYAATLACWIGYCRLAQVVDQDGGKLMNVVFLAAPLGAFAAGLIGAFWLAFRAARRLQRAAR
jgi:hypothetical protein